MIVHMNNRGHWQFLVVPCDGAYPLQSPGLLVAHAPLRPGTVDYTLFVAALMPMDVYPDADRGMIRDLVISGPKTAGIWGKPRDAWWNISINWACTSKSWYFAYEMVRPWYGLMDERLKWAGITTLLEDPTWDCQCWAVVVVGFASRRIGCQHLRCVQDTNVFFFV